MAHGGALKVQCKISREEDLVQFGRKVQCKISREEDLVQFSRNVQCKISGRKIWSNLVGKSAPP